MTESTPRHTPHAHIVYGGWAGHQPREMAMLFADWLMADGFTVETSDQLTSLRSLRHEDVDLIVPVWTMGEIADDDRNAVVRAVAGGTGLAGCHGGMCDAFRNDTAWQFLTGGQFVAHPGDDGVRYRVDVGNNGDHPAHAITEGVESFEVRSEQYYLHIDPAVRVLASTIVPPPTMMDDDATRRAHPDLFGPHTANGPVRMPVIWTKRFGEGRVFYNALGHTPAVLEAEPLATIMRRGFLWAARRL